jgi:glycosyltransferase involved in cell wall biosynthesis
VRILVTTAIYPTPPRPTLGTFVGTQVEWLRRIGVDVEVMLLDGRIRKLIYPRAVFQIRRRLAAERFDLVHAHYGYVGVVSAIQRRVPVVVTFHGDDVLGSMNRKGRLTRFSRMMAAVNIAVGERVDAAIVQTPAMASRFRRPDVHVIPHEVDLSVFKPTELVTARRELGLDPDRRYLLFASPPDIAVKRFPLARAVADAMRAEDPSVELLVVHRESQERLALYMSACDALLFPSFQEGSPNIVKQAMACNMPIVSTDVGDVRVVVGETDGCYVCDPDVESFTTQLRKLLARAGRTDGRRGVARFEGSVVAQRIADVYADVIERRQAQGERTQSPLSSIADSG